MNRTNQVIQKTTYPHIVKIDGVCGGQAIIEGTRIAVWHIVGYYYKVGLSVDEILMDWDYLMPAQVFSALAYCHDNKDEIDKVRQQNSYEHWLKQVKRKSNEATNSAEASLASAMRGMEDEPIPTYSTMDLKVAFS